VTRKDYAVAINNAGNGVDDPDQQFYENCACGSARSYSGYCNPELDKKFDEQSKMKDQEQQRKLVWKLTSVYRRTGRGRSSITCSEQHACSPGSKG
jgi:peptide/nickel transport system substrate-binding protein